MDKSKLQLNESHLKQILTIGYTTVAGETIHCESPNGRLLIENKEFVGQIKITQPLSQKDRQVIFKDCLFSQFFQFDSFSNINSLKFVHCKFQDNVMIRNANRDLEISQDCHFRRTCMIAATERRGLTISNSFFEIELLILGRYARLEFSDLNMGIDMSPDGPKLNFQACIADHSNFKNIQFWRIWFSDSSHFLFEANFKWITCYEFSLNHTLIGLLVHFIGCKMDVLVVDNIKKDPNNPHRFLKFSENCVIGNASIALHMLDSTEAENCHFKDLKLWSNTSSSNIFKLTHCELDKFLIVDVINRGFMSLRDITLRPNQIIGFINSDLGGMDFIKCDFSEGVMEFQNSKIMGTFLAETDFPKKVTVEGKVSTSQSRLAFGQLQTAFQKQGDTVRSLEYQSREIEAHYDDIKWFKKDFLTKVNLCLNKISNYFGRWWGLGVAFTFVTGFGAFLGLLCSTDGFHFSFHPDVRFGYSDSFWKFMNPLRHFDTQSLFEKHPEITPTGSSYFIDFLSRVVIAYGYYQTIQAFRRYGRK